MVRYSVQGKSTLQDIIMVSFTRRTHSHDIFILFLVLSGLKFLLVICNCKTCAVSVLCDIQSFVYESMCFIVGNCYTSKFILIIMTNINMGCGHERNKTIIDIEPSTPFRSLLIYWQCLRLVVYSYRFEQVLPFLKVKIVYLDWNYEEKSRKLFLCVDKVDC